MRIVAAASLQMALTVVALCAVGLPAEESALHSRASFSFVALQAPVQRSFELTDSPATLSLANGVDDIDRTLREIVEPVRSVIELSPEPDELAEPAETVETVAVTAEAADVAPVPDEAADAPLAGEPLMPIAELPIATAEPSEPDAAPIAWTADASADPAANAPAPRFARPRRFTDPNFMRTMYFTHAALQVTDAVTTLAAVKNGAREINPLLRGAARNPAALIAIKAGAVAGTTIIVEKLRKDRPVVAAVTLVAINAAVAVVAVNNAHVVAKQPRR